MMARFILGPAGAGKTHACVAEAREALANKGRGSLLFIAPKQATFQVERQVVSAGGVGGFSRLSVLSFERVAQRILEESGQARDLLGEQGRTMVLRALLEREGHRLRCLGKASRGVGLAQELSGLLRRFHEHGMDAGTLERLSSKESLPEVLRAKLHDASVLTRGLQSWLADAGLDDPSEREWKAVDLLLGNGLPGHRWDHVWLDGFAEMTPAEVSLLAAIARRSARVTAAFCLDRSAAAAGKPLWRVVDQTFHACHAAIAAAGVASVEVVELRSSPGRCRFVPGGVIEALERRAGSGASAPLPAPGIDSARVVRCRDPHEEAEVAARCVLDAVRAGARYRDVAVLVRSLGEHGPLLERTFRRVGIPCFVDRRHHLRHHPLVELTRSALRVACDPDADEDWFAWLKTGLLPVEAWEADRLENSLMASRWEGHRWQATTRDDRAMDWPRPGIMEPLLAFAHESRASGGLDGPSMANAMRRLWASLGIEARLASWDAEPEGSLRHATVFREVSAWLDEASRAFAGHRMLPAEWLRVAESAWSGLTAGAVPPTLDQVLIGAVDRSRNPELACVILPGWVEGGFPATPPSEGLLSGQELDALLEKAGVGLGPTPLDRVHHEHFYGYVALTRARRAVVVTWCAEGMSGEARVASSLVRRWLMDVPTADAADMLAPGATRLRPHPQLPGEATGQERLPAEAAAALWDGHLETSASGLERMASCRFAFFVGHVLRLNERDDKSADAREEGSWAHHLLSRFHDSLAKEGRPWRSLTAAQGTERLRALAQDLRRQEGIDRGGATVEFAWARAERQAMEWLRHWLDVLADWPGDPEWVEAAFGKGTPWGPMHWPIPSGGTLSLRGRVDRMDVLGRDALGRPRVWVEDYKRGQPRFNPGRVMAGFDLQLPLYLIVASRAMGGVPAGMTYAALRPDRPRSRHREDRPEVASHQHRGRFDWELVRDAAGRMPEWERLPFRFKLKKDGNPALASDGVGASDLKDILSAACARSTELAASMLGGDVSVAPIPDGTRLPCESCPYRGACRVGAGL